MEIREFAERVFFADTLEEKLLSPEGGIQSLKDHNPGEEVPWSQPSRPTHLRIAPPKKRKRFPSPNGLHRPDLRIRCLHAFANHELMALEMMAWALLKFPNAPKAFRLGLAQILIEEQEHFQWYNNRIEEIGAKFGDCPLNDHFWRTADSLTDPLKWVCAMHLTFEQANLDHAPRFQQAFEEVEDLPSAKIMNAIYLDEIKHVRFGSNWLKHFTPEEATYYETYLDNLTYYNTPLRAKGDLFNEEGRRAANLDEEFIRNIQHYSEEDFKRDRTIFEKKRNLIK